MDTLLGFLQRLLYPSTFTFVPGQFESFLTPAIDTRQLAERWQRKG